MKKLLLIIWFAFFSHFVQAQNSIVTISQAYGSRSQRTSYAVTYKKLQTDYVTTYKFGNYTITATNDKETNNIIVNIKTPGILGANDNITIPYGKCDGYVLYKGGAANLLGSSKLEYLVSFRSMEKSYIVINQVMDTETERYHYLLEPLNQQLYTLSKKIWSNCNTSTQVNENNPLNSVKTRSSLNSLRNFNGKYTTQVNFFNNSTVKELLSDIMQGDYLTFKTKFLANAAGVKIEVNNNVLYVYTFQPHWAVDKALFFIDLSNRSCFLYKSIDKKIKIYGLTPLTNNIANFISEKLKNDNKYMAPEDQDLLKNIVDKFGTQEATQSNDTPNTNENATSDIATSVDIQPQFQGGNEAFARFLSNNIKYPPQAITNKTEGRVWLSFIIDEQGAVSNAKVARGIGDGCDEEALRVIKLSPKWLPGRINNRSVKCQITVPISFSN